MSGWAGPYRAPPKGHPTGSYRGHSPPHCQGQVARQLSASTLPGSEPRPAAGGRQDGRPLRRVRRACVEPFRARCGGCSASAESRAADAAFLDPCRSIQQGAVARQVQRHAPRPRCVRMSGARPRRRGSRMASAGPRAATGMPVHPRFFQHRPEQQVQRFQRGRRFHPHGEGGFVAGDANPHARLPDSQA